MRELVRFTHPTRGPAEIALMPEGVGCRYDCPDQADPARGYAPPRAERTCGRTRQWPLLTTPTATRTAMLIPPGEREGCSAIASRPRTSTPSRGSSAAYCWT